jgi:hypothetical protein
MSQTLVPENIRQVAVGSTTAQVRDLLGPPARTGSTALKPLDVWEYRWLAGIDRRVLWVGFSTDGVAREVTDMHDYDWEPSTGGGGFN